VRGRVVAIASVLLSLPSAALGAFGSDADVRQFLKARFDAQGANSADTRAAIAFHDLNGDGLKDALAYVSGPSWCGSGGCKLYVLQNQGRTYRVVARTTVTRPPIRVLSARTKGWQDIGVSVAGGGVATHNAVLRFTGQSYPGNPSTQPALAGHDGTLLIDEDTRSAPL
jgi:hypothetical protein